MLGEESEMVRRSLQAQKQNLRFVEPPLPDQIVHEPESAQQEGSLVAGKPVVAAIAVNEPSFVEFPADRRDGAHHARVVVGEKIVEWQQETAGIERFRVVVLDEGLFLVAPALFQDLFADGIAGLFPQIAVGGKAVAPGDGQAPVERDPAHHLGIDEVIRAAADFPDPRILLPPDLDHGLAHGAQKRPHLHADFADVVRQAQRRVHELAVDVELQLVVGAVADAHRARLLVALEVTELLLGKPGFATEPVEHLQAGTAFAYEAFEPLQIPLHFGEVADVEKGFDGQGGIAYPGIAVVPVALAAHFLGQGCRRRGGDGACGREIEQLEDQTRSLGQ